MARYVKILDYDVWFMSFLFKKMKYAYYFIVRNPLLKKKLPTSKPKNCKTSLLPDVPR